jgi:hypothetical protein
VSCCYVVERFVHTGVDSYLGMGSPPNHNTLHIFRFDAIIYVKLKCIASSLSQYKMAPTEEHQQTTAFHHSDAAWQNTIKSEMDVTREYGHNEDANLGKFLSRPVQIAEGGWSTTVGIFAGLTFNPWTEFLSNPHVADKIRGYRMLQGKMHVRLAINGGPMFYGKAIMAYEPRHLQNDFGLLTGSPSDAMTMQLSMLPHVYIDTTTSTGGQLDLPFFCPDNWIDLLGDTAEEMGRVYVRSINDLQHANSSTAIVQMKVYAWMTDVKLCGPTTRTSGAYVAQAGTEIAVGAAGLSIVGALVAWMNHIKCSYVGSDRTSHSGGEPPPELEAQAGDEYGSGIISKPASIVARVAGALTGIPKIAPYATATQMVASALGSWAHHFGFSRPNIVSTVQRCRIVNTGILANADQHDTAIKLALDSKTEVTIDPRVVGLSDVDEMAFEYIKQKEVFIGQETWSESDLEDHLLFGLTVGPDYHQLHTQDGYTAHILAPMYTVAAPFQYWRGTIIFRFQIVASQLHRGRLRITYDPYIHDTPYDENEVYTRIIDLAENRDFEIPVSWNQAKSWLRVRNNTSLQGNGFVGTHTAGGGTQIVSANHHNGSLRMEVLNSLTSPNPALAQPVYVNVFVRAGSDFEVAGPTSAMLETLEYLPNTSYQPQSGYEAHAGEEEVVAEKDDIPESPPDIVPVGSPDSLDDPLYHVFMGERISSVRSLIKRYCFHKIILGESNSYSHSDFNFPTHKGQFEVRNSTTDAATIPASETYQFSAMTPLTWFKPCYVGWRGGLRSKYIPFNITGTVKDGMLAVKRLAEPLLAANVDTTDMVYNSGVTGGHLDLIGGVNGSEVSLFSTEGACEVEFPYITYRRFAHCRKEMDGTGSNDEPFTGEHQGHILFMSGGTVSLHKYVAAGDDFSYHFWCGQPPVIRRVTPLSGNWVGPSQTT